MKTFISIPVYFLLFFTLLSTTALAQNTGMYLKVKGKVQGEIKGDAVEKGKEGQIKVAAYSHEITSPRDVATGQASGKRQHKPFVITKELDKSSPLLFKALTTNETLSEVTLNLYRNTSGKLMGTIEQFFTITLSDATITGIQSHPNDKGVPYEEISLTYQKIVWTYTDGGVTHEDTWNNKQ